MNAVLMLMSPGFETDYVSQKLQKN